MYGKILVSLDGSALAEQVLPYVRPLAKALVAGIELLRTIPSASHELADPSSTNSQDQALDYLRGISASLNDLGVSISRAIDPASWITSEAEKEPGTLIAMSTHGRSGVARWLLGSVADRVIRHSGVPVLVVRASEQLLRDVPAPASLEINPQPLGGTL